MSVYLSIFRVHIILIAVLGTLTFGWIFTGKYLIALALIAGLDWLLINLANRVSDVTEDLANQIPGSRRVAGSQVAFLAFFVVTLLGSFVVTVHWFPQITGWRILGQMLGLVYNFKIIPTSKGLARLKDQYLLKNSMSAFGFFITCFGYTWAVGGYNPQIGWAGAIVLLAFFIPYELSFEIFYDLRDVPGDRLAGVKTYPVVHGQAVSQKIINALLGTSLLILIAGVLFGWVGLREMLMAAGPVIQFFVLRKIIARGVTSADCINVTHLGTAMLALFLIGTALWSMAGLPANIYL